MLLSLKAARVYAGYTQKNAAEKIGVAQSTLRNYEHKVTFPPTDIVYKISKAYGLDIKDIDW
ncbi:MAG: helix-turn-helix transcriptional regulator [Selenomonadaceae bacterium]